MVAEGRSRSNCKVLCQNRRILTKICPFLFQAPLSLSLITDCVISVFLSVFHCSRVFFRGVTWMRDSHGLFDYESRNISKKNLKTKYVGKIIRQSNTIEFISPNTAVEDLPGYKKDEILTLAQIKQDNSKFRTKNRKIYSVFRAIFHQK